MKNDELQGYTKLFFPGRDHTSLKWNTNKMHNPVVLDFVVSYVMEYRILFCLLNESETLKKPKKNKSLYHKSE